MRVNFLNDIRRLNNINKVEPKLHLVVKEQHILHLDFNNIQQLNSNNTGLKIYIYIYMAFKYITEKYNHIDLNL